MLFSCCCDPCYWPYRNSRQFPIIIRLGNSSLKLHGRTSGRWRNLVIVGAVASVRVPQMISNGANEKLLSFYSFCSRHSCKRELTVETESHMDVFWYVRARKPFFSVIVVKIGKQHRCCLISIGNSYSCSNDSLRAIPSLLAL